MDDHFDEYHDGVAGFLGAVHERFAPGDTAVEGLRERKKRLMRQRISDTATGMFLERGFDEVKVAEIAAACGVSEKTVYNYFPTKESLMLDREDGMAEAIRLALGPGDPTRSPIDAVVGVITDDLNAMFDHWDDGADDDFREMLGGFSRMIETTPSLRAAQLDMMERLLQVAAEAMAERAGIDPDDPEPQAAAGAIMGLWRIEYRGMVRYADGIRGPAEVRAAVLADIHRAARLIDTGLWSFNMEVQGASSRQQLREAADAANDARKQVVAALKQARDAWKQVKDEVKAAHHAHDAHEHRGGGRDRQQAQRMAQQARADAHRIAQQAQRDAQAARADAQRVRQLAKRDGPAAQAEAQRVRQQAERNAAATKAEAKRLQDEALRDAEGLIRDTRRRR